MTDRYKRLPSLTAGRGLASLMVASFHATNVWPGSLSAVASFGWLGVTFFFVLSGFVLTWSRSDERPYAEFMVHRVARIFPVHLLCLIASVGLFFIFRKPFGGYIGTPVGTVLQVFLVHDFVPGHPEIRQAWDGVAWSLSAEFFFYLFAPFIIRYLASLKSNTLINVGVAIYIIHMSIGVIAQKTHSAQLYDFMQYHPIAYLPMFAYGIIGAILMRRGTRVQASMIVKVLLFVPLFVYCFRLADRDGLAMMALTVPAFVVFILDQARRDAAGENSILAHSLLEKIGEISFSLYMVHAMVLAAMQYAIHIFNVPFHPTIYLLVFLLVSLAASYAMYEIVERPMRKYFISRILGKRKTAMA